MKERFQEIDDKNDELRAQIAKHRERAADFLERFEMSWIYHDAALDGVVYTPQELQTALRPGAMPAEASLLPIILEIRNHKAAVDYIREEAKTSKKNSAITLTVIKRIHDLLSGNTPDAQAARAAAERRERTERELAKEKERSGYRKDMPLHRTYFHEISQPAKIQPLLEKLIDHSGSAEFREFHPIKQAAAFQQQFIQIFPFTEHSGKVGRMCSNLVLLRSAYLPCVIHSIDRQKYYEGFRQSPTVFRGLLLEAIENSLDNGIKFFRDLQRRYRAIN